MNFIKEVFTFFVSYFLLFMLLSHVVTSTHFLTTATIYCVKFILSLFNFNALLLEHSDIILVDYVGVEIIPDCTCYFEVVLFLSLLLSLGFISLREKIIFSFVGLPILFLFSVVRVSSVIVVGVLYGAWWFDVFHTYIWSFSAIMFPAVLLLVLVKVSR